MIHLSHVRMRKCREICKSSKGKFRWSGLYIEHGGEVLLHISWRGMVLDGEKRGMAKNERGTSRFNESDDDIQLTSKHYKLL